jgi:hypothetical protein
MDWTNWKCRCSAIGMIMTPPKLKEDKDAGRLGETAKGYLKQCYVESKYGRTYEISSKYIDKGVLTEADCLKMLSSLDNKEYKKNEERAENEYLTGTPDFYAGPDIRHATYILECKSSWSLFSFIDNLEAKLDKNYIAQINGYFAITGAKEGEVSYCLVDAPESIILDEKKSLLWKMSHLAATEENPDYIEAAAQLEINMIFPDIPPEHRRVKFEVKRDDEYIKRVYAQVEKCRIYLSEIESLHMSGS